jgi:hypothetical protein
LLWGQGDDFLKFLPLELMDTLLQLPSDEGKSKNKKQMKTTLSSFCLPSLFCTNSKYKYIYRLYDFVTELLPPNFEQTAEFKQITVCPIPRKGFTVPFLINGKIM